ncbi:hypothetical protein [Acidomonas methanolica]|uniref:Uncharacterized protein n=1 Tax=Acidomonas methanolica NBRC 104435 TaxID=1231351 RepID=A0A023D6M5_ACIMT|nr:hypothetical protein [Acidomonas methanolica]TCS24123.1 hypothetical protein EDC31_12544 [Acidomonas methanolica]GAJ29724.1 hypothetical protein Amme_076_017 [Acidomonas methanolica NBRC 104435]GBQ59478.1 hypothetical protein AA0498_2764 [Acidomonas methanolica]GEL00038.1 hypothetical protein AME01nite_25360 [Acidomonas methanolica NBRC 104435]
MRAVIDRLRKIRAVVLYGDTTGARWWERQYGRAAAERDALRADAALAPEFRVAMDAVNAENARLRAEVARLRSQIDGEAVFPGAERVQDVGQLGDCGQTSKCPVAASDAPLPKRDAKGRFARG